MSLRSAADLYEDDFYAWVQLQARELRRFARTRPNLPLDLAHIAEEIAGLGKNQRDSMRSWARRIIEHLLLLELFPCKGAATRLDRRNRQSAQRDRGSPDSQLAPGSEAPSPASLRPGGAKRPAQEARSLRGRARCRSFSRALSLYARSGSRRFLVRPRQLKRTPTAQGDWTSERVWLFRWRADCLIGWGGTFLRGSPAGTR
jgi:Domain of unknown function DUF29